MKIVQRSKYLKDICIGDIIAYNNNVIDEHKEYEVTLILKAREDGSLAIYMINQGDNRYDNFSIIINKDELEKRRFVRNSDYNWYIKYIT